VQIESRVSQETPFCHIYTHFFRQLWNTESRPRHQEMAAPLNLTMDLSRTLNPLIQVKAPSSNLVSATLSLQARHPTRFLVLKYQSLPLATVRAASPVAH
jgi:hypothetical protein